MLSASSAGEPSGFTPPTNPQKSLVWISATKVGFDGFGIGITVSLPIPLLLICLKFNLVKDCAIPVMGISTPSSCMKIPSEKSGSNDTHLMPNSSLCKKNPFPPGEPAES